jgi:hypothetical protein
MTEITFDRLRDVALRDAWKHEALSFTPWLAQNIDHIAEAIGVPLELTGTEVAVGSFSADILARNPQNDSLVLIENQLEQTDHSHLGQIMTYLAGLDAKTVVWIAPSFREPHLSAIRWLNLHTADGFSFFALRLRVVRIGDSPFAPIFEVIEKPSEWDRTIRTSVEEADRTPYDNMQKFWTAFLSRRPDLQARGIVPVRFSNNWIRLLSEPEINLSLYIGKSSSGAFLRGARGTPISEVANLLRPVSGQLAASIGAQFIEGASRDYLFETSIAKGHTDPENWPSIMDWMEKAINTYSMAIWDAFPGANP